MQPADDELARLADELLEQVRALRQRYEELSVAIAEAGVESGLAADGRAQLAAEGSGGADNFRAMALQMSFAGHSREDVKEYLRTFEFDGSDELVDDVFDRIQPRESEPARRRIFSRRAE